jgi:hypothetical protein
VRLGLECNNRCVFCAQAGLEGAAPPAVREQLAAARVGDDEVTFIGGEPSLDPALPSHVALARSMGFVRVGLQTNGHGLARAASTLEKAGLTDVHLSLHGADAAVHDYHTGVGGSFAQAVEGLRATRAAGLDGVVATVLTRSNFRSLSALPGLLSSTGAAGWLVVVPRTGGRLGAAFDRVMPRLALALPFALRALDAGEALGLPVWIAGAPDCLLGECVRWVLREEAREFGAGCDGCAAREVCAGVDAGYLERFAGDELRAQRVGVLREGALASRRATTSRMFVGVGEIAPAPRSVRVTLPVAGRVKAAEGEVRPHTPRKTGEALREILPGLFEPGARER